MPAEVEGDDSCQLDVPETQWLSGPLCQEPKGKERSSHGDMRLGVVPPTVCPLCEEDQIRRGHRPGGKGNPIRQAVFGLIDDGKRDARGDEDQVRGPRAQLRDSSQKPVHPGSVG